MKIIERIEIKNFRSFWNRKTKTKNRDEIFELDKTSELNIISWWNDSWKSNILRALNLFFNWKTDLDIFFDFKKDFHKKERNDEDVKEEVVTIKIWFINPENKWRNQSDKEWIYLPKKFWIAKKWWKNSNFSQPSSEESSILTDFKKEKWNYYSNFIEEDKNWKTIIKRYVHAWLQKDLTKFLSSIKYHYIPAIKDKNYFSYLYWELQETLFKEKISWISSSQNKFEWEIQKETLNLMKEFESVLNDTKINFKPLFKLPENLVDVFKTLEVDTWNISLESRWDWIQAKLIPEILNFISIKESSIKPTKIKSWFQRKRYFIWWFEEPENSYEYKNAQLLANRFLDTFSNSAQIFITTHSFNFLSLESENLSLYRVHKDNNIFSTKIKKVIKNKDWLFKYESFRKSFLDENEDLLNEELWILQLNKDLELKYIEYKNKINKLNNIIIEANKDDKICLLTEWTTDVKYLKIIFDKYLKNWEERYKFIDTNHGQSNSAESLKNLLLSISATSPNSKYIWIFDNDKEWKEKVDLLKKKNLNNNIKFTTLPELEWWKDWEVILKIFWNTETKIDLNWNSLTIEMYFWKIFENNFSKKDKKFIFEQVPKLPDNIKDKLQELINNTDFSNIELEDWRLIVNEINSIFL